MSSQDQWEPCATGQVSDLVASLRGTERSRKFRRRMVVGGGAAVLLLCCLVGVQLLTPAAKPLAMRCSEFREYTDDIIANTIPAELVDRIKAHLGHCEGCRNHIASVRNDSAKRDTSTGDSVAMVPRQILQIPRRR